MKKINEKKLLLKLKKTLLVANLSFAGISTLDSSLEKEKYTLSTNFERNVNIVDYFKSNKLEIEESSKQYYDSKCPYELQDHIFKKCEQYGVSSDIVMTIIEKESNGTWASNGVISRTNDYGLAQINICNLSFVEQNLGYNKEQILNDPYKNVEASIYLLTNIIEKSTKNNKVDYENVFGMYNGWVNWRNIPSSVDYAKGCMNILENKYSEKISVNFRKVKIK